MGAECRPALALLKLPKLLTSLSVLCSEFRYVFGDVPRPNQAAAELIEAVIHKHMTKIVSDFTHSCTGGVGRMYWV